VAGNEERTEKSVREKKKKRKKKGGREGGKAGLGTSQLSGPNDIPREIECVLRAFIYLTNI